MPSKSPSWAPTCAEAEVAATVALLRGTRAVPDAPSVIVGGRRHRPPLDHLGSNRRASRPRRGGRMNTWILLRAAGIGSYLMLFLSIAWGLVATTSVVTKRISKPSANLFHAFVATTGLALLGVHLGLLLIDEFMPFSFARPHRADGVGVSRRSRSRPASSRCTRSWSSWCRRGCASRSARRGGGACTSSPCRPSRSRSLHGVFAGTDTERPWMFAIYAITGLLVVFLTLVRAFTYGYRPPRPAPPGQNPTHGTGDTGVIVSSSSQVRRSSRPTTPGTARTAPQIVGTSDLRSMRPSRCTTPSSTSTST